MTKWQWLLKANQTYILDKEEINGLAWGLKTVVTMSWRKMKSVLNDFWTWPVSGLLGSWARGLQPTFAIVCDTESPVSLFLLCLVRAFKKKTASSCEQPAWVMPAHPLRWLSPTRTASHGQCSFQGPKEWTQSNPKNQTKWEHGNWILGQATGGGSLLRLSGLQIITPRPTHWRSTCFV